MALTKKDLIRALDHYAEDEPLCYLIFSKDDIIEYLTESEDFNEATVKRCLNPDMITDFIDTLDCYQGLYDPEAVYYAIESNNIVDRMTSASEEAQKLAQSEAIDGQNSAD